MRSPPSRVYGSVNIQMCGWIVAPSDSPEMNTKRAGRGARSVPSVLLPLMVVFLLPRRCENRLWEQRFLLLLFRLAKAHYKPSARLELEDTCLRLLVKERGDQSYAALQGGMHQLRDAQMPSLCRVTQSGTGAASLASMYEEAFSQAPDLGSSNRPVLPPAPRSSQLRACHGARMQQEPLSSEEAGGRAMAGSFGISTPRGSWRASAHLL
ncbi:uncharacterized protein [Nyctibius grandis]|uniref:uncharacterized protein n=1 Tax=Nyctibius grandis TaxID=48427 RepID=UPI0035BC5B2B